MVQIPSRQVHLDFHTSGLIPGVGAKFDKKQFQAALKAGHLNSITVFAKCHHSWSYYNTKAGQKHPTMKGELLRGQVEAAHEIGVRAPIYITVGWSANDAEQHPEWIARAKDGQIHTTDGNLRGTPNANAPRPMVSWKTLCPTGEYRQLILAQTREVCEQFDVDGLFFDICFGPVCYCDRCKAGMKKAGLDVEKEADAKKYHQMTWTSFMDEATAVLRERWPEATIYFNGSANQYTPQWHYAQTHFELEDLPTTWGGYDKFPIRSKYFAKSGKAYLAMSGKFHTMWGEFGGFKHPDAIRYETAAMIAFGARASFGDQVHPSGEMDMATYRNIGVGYEYMERYEQYGLDGRPFSRLGLWMCGSEPHDQGVVNMLLESQMDFDVVDQSGDLSSYETIILPGAQCLDKKSAQRINEFVANGGNLVVVGESALDPAKKKFILNIGAKYAGPAKYNQDYLKVGKKISAGLVESPFLNYSSALRAKLNDDSEALAEIYEPYFDRTYKHYCSHQNTPYQLKPAAHPGAWKSGNVVCLPHPLGAIYYAHGARVHRDIFINALKLVYKKPVLAVGMPSAGRVNLLHQPEQRRYVAHLLYGPPLQRGRCLVIEDLVPIFNIPLELRVPQKIKRAWMPLEEMEIETAKSAGALRLVVPHVQCHQMVVFEY